MIEDFGTLARQQTISSQTKMYKNETNLSMEVEDAKDMKLRQQEDDENTTPADANCSPFLKRFVCQLLNRKKGEFIMLV